jgi:hypothetical protein
MADPPRYPEPEADTGDDTGVGPGSRSKPGMPRWLKVSLIIVIAAVVLVVVLLRIGVFGGGGHGG